MPRPIGALRGPMNEIERILREARTIAVVGLSDNPARDSHHVAEFLQSQGYRIIPVNPNAEHILGAPCRASLSEIAEPVDIVDIFRRSDAVAPIVDDAIKLGAKCVWMQEGVVNPAAAAKARDAGLLVVMDSCILKVHRAMGIPPIEK